MAVEMENVRIAVLDSQDNVLAYLDNTVPKAMHYYDDKLHLYLTGSAYTFEFATLSTHEDSCLLETGNALSFLYKDKGYYLKIMSVEKDELELRVTAYGSSFAFLNDYIDRMNFTGLTFEEAIASVNGGVHPEAGKSPIAIGINEIPTAVRSGEFSGSDTLLARLFALADLYDAEIEIVNEVGQDHALSEMHLNVYHKHDDIWQGIGQDRRDEILRYGKDIEGISRTSDITDLITAIQPTGSGDLTLSAWVNPDESELKDVIYDESGSILYERKGGIIYAPQSRDRFPSAGGFRSDGYITGLYSSNAATYMELYKDALSELKTRCTPKLSYTTEGYVQAGIGDMVTIEDTAYSPPLFVEARVIEQEICFTNPIESKTTFDNFTEVSSELLDTLTKTIEEMVNESRTYDAVILMEPGSDGLIFKNGNGQSTFIASVRDRGLDITNRFIICWYKNGELIHTGKKLSVKAEDIEVSATYRFDALGNNDQVRASCTFTVTGVEDGKTTWTVYAWANSEDGQEDFCLTPEEGKEYAYLGYFVTVDPNPESNPILLDYRTYVWQKIPAGPQGEPGSSQTIVSISTQYYLSVSDKEPEGGTWMDEYPDYDREKFLWSRIKTTYTRPDVTLYSDPILDELWIQTGRTLLQADLAAATAKAASDAAAEAERKAEEAQKQAAETEAALEPVRKGIDEAKEAAEAAKQEIAEKTQQMLVDIAETYAAKSDVTEMEGALSAQISANATAIASKVSQSDYQKNSEETDKKLSDLADDLEGKQESLSALLSEQSRAKVILSDAQKKLKEAQDALAALQANPDATSSQINAAKEALASAQKALDKAQADVNKADAAVKKVQQDIEGVIGDIGELESRITTAETNIGQNAKEIELKASKSEVSEGVKESKDYTDAQIKLSADSIKDTVYSKTEADGKIAELKNEVEQTVTTWSSTITQEITDASVDGSLAEKVQALSNTLIHRSDGVWLSATGNETSNTALWLQNASISFVIGGDTTNPPMILQPDNAVFQKITVRKSMELGPADKPLIATFGADGSGIIG